MIQIDAPLAAILITTLIALLGMAVAWGTLREKVKNNCKDIESNYKQNREDHQMLFNKMEDIQRDVRNGQRNHGG